MPTKARHPGKERRQAALLSKKPHSWQDFFKLTEQIDIPQDFPGKRDLRPPQKRKLF